MFMSILFTFIWFRVKFWVREAVKIILWVQSLHLYFPLPFYLGLTWILYVSWHIQSFGHLAWGFCNFGWGDIFCCCWHLSSSFSWFLQKGQSGPHPHFSANCSLTLGSSFFIGGLGLVIPVTFLLSRQFGGSNQFLSSKRLPDTFPAPGHGVLSWTGTFSKGGGLFSGTSVLGCTLAGAFDTVAGRWMAIGLKAALGLSLVFHVEYTLPRGLSYLIWKCVSPAWIWSLPLCLLLLPGVCIWSRHAESCILAGVNRPCSEI